MANFNQSRFAGSDRLMHPLPTLTLNQMLGRRSLMRFRKIVGGGVTQANITLGNALGTKRLTVSVTAKAPQIIPSVRCASVPCVDKYSCPFNSRRTFHGTNQFPQ
jgi:hypothetical protein